MGNVILKFYHFMTWFAIFVTLLLHFLVTKNGKRSLVQHHVEMTSEWGETWHGGIIGPPYGVVKV